jgi:hypothetical protein
VALNAYLLPGLWTLGGPAPARVGCRAAGRMEGLSAEHEPVHLLRAEEGSFFEIRVGIDALRSGRTAVSQVILAGRRLPRCAAQLRANAWGSG